MTCVTSAPAEDRICDTAMPMRKQPRNSALPKGSNTVNGDRRTITTGRNKTTRHTHTHTNTITQSLCCSPHHNFRDIIFHFGSSNTNICDFSGRHDNGAKANTASAGPPEPIFGPTDISPGLLRNK